MKRYTNEVQMSAGRNGFVYGYQKAKAHGNSPACYHVGCFGEGGEKEIRFGAGKDGLLLRFSMSDMVLTKNEAQKWTEEKCK